MHPCGWDWAWVLAGLVPLANLRVCIGTNMCRSSTGKVTELCTVCFRRANVSVPRSRVLWRVERADTVW